MYSIMINIGRVCIIYWGDSNVSISLAPLPENTIHLLPMSELNIQGSVCSNKAVANNSTSVPHIEFLFMFYLTT